jgi:hypothetical protein
LDSEERRNAKTVLFGSGIDPVPSGGILIGVPETVRKRRLWVSALDRLGWRWNEVVRMLSSPALGRVGDAAVNRLSDEACAAREAFLKAETKTEKRRASELLDRAIQDIGSALGRTQSFETPL